MKKYYFISCVSFFTALMALFGFVWQSLAKTNEHALKIFTADVQSSTFSSASSTNVSWGEPHNGLMVGIACNVDATNESNFPQLFLYLTNVDSQIIHGIIRSGAECIVTVNGKHYAQEDWGGKGSSLSPGKGFGPIPIQTEYLKQVSEMRVYPVIEPRASRPKLTPGTNFISLHFRVHEPPTKLGKLVKSGEIQVLAK